MADGIYPLQSAVGMSDEIYTFQIGMRICVSGNNVISATGNLIRGLHEIYTQIGIQEFQFNFQEICDEDGNILLSKSPNIH